MIPFCSISHDRHKCCDPAWYFTQNTVSVLIDLPRDALSGAYAVLSGISFCLCTPRFYDQCERIDACPAGNVVVGSSTEAVPLKSTATATNDDATPCTPRGQRSTAGRATLTDGDRYNEGNDEDVEYYGFDTVSTVATVAQNMTALTLSRQSRL
jgi:hypothetical protein